MKTLLILFLSIGTLQATPPMDKVSHFAVGSTIYGGSYCLSYKLTNNKAASTIIGIGMTAAIATAKEIHDRNKWGSPMNESIKDLAYTMGGALAASVVIKITF